MGDKGLKEVIEKLAERFPHKGSALLPALCYLQNAEGYVSKEGMKSIALILGIPEAKVFSTASFYSMLKLRPRGRYNIRICTNLVCTLLEPNPLLEYISNAVGIESGGVTPDGLFSIEEVECLGACGYSPAMEINEERYESLTYEKVDEILESIKKSEGKN